MKIALTLFLSWISIQALSQPIKYSLYISENRIPSDSAEAVYIRHVEHLGDSLYKIADVRINDSTKSLEGTIKIDYSKINGLTSFNHKGKEKGNSSSEDSYDRKAFEGWHVKYGQFTSYYANGNIESLGTYIDGDKVGQFRYWYHNGTFKETLFHSDSITISPFYKVIEYYDSLGNQRVSNGNGVYENSTAIIEFESGEVYNGYKKGKWTGRFLKNYLYEETYSNGVFESGITTDSAGNQYRYEQLEIQAEYVGGWKKFYKYIRSNLRYPAKARKKGIQGRVFVEFVVDKQGNTTEVKVLNGFCPECDEQARSVIDSVNNFVPGKMKRIPVRQRMILPITFSL
jgi:TonB family protein